MFKTDSFLGNKKLSLNQNGKQCCLSALELFHCLPPLFHYLPLWTVRLHGKKLQNATNFIILLNSLDNSNNFLVDLFLTTETLNNVLIYDKRLQSKILPEPTVGQLHGTIQSVAKSFMNLNSRPRTLTIS